MSIRQGPIGPEDQVSLVGALVDQASRDLVAWTSCGENYRLAGRAALNSINSAILCLENARRALEVELDNDPAPSWTKPEPPWRSWRRVRRQ